MPARYKILVVEDSPANAGAFSALLRLAGYRTATATDGPSGLIQMAVDTPDLILLDHYLPAMNDPQKTPPPAGETGEGRAGLNDPHEQSGQSQQQAQQAEHQVHHGLRSHGLDDHTIQQAKARGMDLHGLLSLLQQKGPQVRELVTAILGLFGSQGGAGPQPGA